MKNALTMFAVFIGVALGWVAPTVAQEATPEATPQPDKQIIVSVDGKLTIQIPADWVLKNDSSTDNPISLKLATSDAALAKELFNQDDVFQPGEAHIDVAVVETTQWMQTVPAGTLTAESTPLQVAQVLLQQGTPDNFTFGTPGELTINGLAAARMNLAVPQHGGGQLLLTIYDKKWLVGVLLFAAPGENDKWDIIARDILTSVTTASGAEAAPTATGQPPREPLALTQTAKTQNGLGTLSYPDQWVSRQFGTSSLYIANTEAALSKSFGSVLESGQVNILISMSTTDDYIKQAGLSAKADVTPLELMQLTIKAVGADVTFATPQTTTVADKPAARVEFQSAGYAGVAWLIEYQKGATIAVQMLAAPGESSLWEPTTLAIAASVHSTD